MNYKYWACQLLGWGTFAFLSIYQSSKEESRESIWSDIAFAVFSIFITHVARTLFYKKNWNQLLTEKIVLRIIASVILQAIIVSILYLSTLKIFYNQVYLAQGKSNFLGLFFASVITIGAWHCIYFIIKFVERNRKLVIERLQMENSVKSLEIKNIKNNLQPHFIFNALNSIRALVDEDPDRARQSITQLSNILRSSIQVDKIETVPMKKELEIVQDYLSLEGIRYEERLKTIYNIHDNTLELPVPPLMLQTLVENAIKHGISAVIKGGFIELKSFIASNAHQIIIRNTGQFDPGHSTAVSSNGFGLESTRERLQFLFGTDAILEIKNESKEIVTLQISIPIQKN